MTKSIRNDNRGLTLVELIVGVVILAIIVTPLLHALVTGASSAKKSKQYNDATLAAQNIVENIEATDMKTFLDGVDPISDEDDANYGNYVLTQAAESGGTNFDAKIIITPQQGDIAVSSAMSTQLAMQGEDESVYLQYIGELAGGTPGKLKRTITIDVEPISEDDDTMCRLTATFTYSATINYKDDDGNARTKPFNRTVTQRARMFPLSTKPAAFMFFCDVPEYDGDEILSSTTGGITINNTTNASFSLYLIDTSENQSTGAHEVYYYTTDKTSMNLMTNLKLVKFKAFVPGSQTWMRSNDVPVSLVKTETIDRGFSIAVEIYKDGEISTEGAVPLFTLNTEKLDYSIQ